MTCRHGMITSTCAICNPVKGRDLRHLRSGTGSKNARRAKRTKHSAPAAWTPDARRITNHLPVIPNGNTNPN